MKIQIDGVDLFEISATDRKILEHDLPADQVDDEIKRRIKYIMDHKCDKIYSRIKAEWVDSGKLEELGVQSIPTSKQGLIDLVTARPEYKNRTQRIAEEAEPA